MVILGNLGKIMTSKQNLFNRTWVGWVELWLKGVGMDYIMIKFLIKAGQRYFGFKTEDKMIKWIFSPNK